MKTYSLEVTIRLEIDAVSDADLQEKVEEKFPDDLIDYDIVDEKPCTKREE